MGPKPQGRVSADRAWRAPFSCPFSPLRLLTPADPNPAGGKYPHGTSSQPVCHSARPPSRSGTRQAPPPTPPDSSGVASALFSLVKQNRLVPPQILFGPSFPLIDLTLRGGKYPPDISILVSAQTRSGTGVPGVSLISLPDQPVEFLAAPFPSLPER